MKLKLASPAFEHQEEIPSRFTCEGKNISPPLHWTGVPKEAKSLVLIVDDPDAPDPRAPKRTWVHWVLYNIPVSVSQIAEGKKCESALEGLNDWNQPGYGGPCPPTGRHRYFHKLYALDTVLPDLGFPSKEVLLEAMQGHVLAVTELVGTFRRKLDE